MTRYIAKDCSCPRIKGMAVKPVFNLELNWLELQSALLVVSVLCVFAAFTAWRAR